MSQKHLRKNIAAYNGLDLGLFFASEVLKLKSLHFGYWARGEELTLVNFRRAQARYTEKLMELIPEKVKTILDVGAGIGDNAFTLARHGYDVVAISPDANHKRYFDAMDGDPVRFYGVEFERLNLNEKFGLILMAESHNYFHADVGFAQAKRYLHDWGYLVVSGIFATSNKAKLRECYYTEEEYVTIGKSYGFSLTKRADITDSVLPTLGFAQDAHNKYFTPSLALIRHYLESSAPLKLKLLKLFFWRQHRELRNLQTFYEERLNPRSFRERAVYLTLLFSLSGNNHEPLSFD